ncbi:hypothetical protein GHK28_10435 [Sinorhizobium medicae]|nr:hypothetical protein [Sinorhizobium medicae]MQV72341.1 hypothetical protein [Sinorhizobium medicae]
MIANPIYGGAYAYGKSRSVPGYDGRSGIRRKAREWLALIPDAHEGYVSWERAEEIRKMVSRHHGAPKHGDALLAGLFRCKRCDRKLTVRYTGSNHNIPRYSCWRGLLDNGEPRCIAFGGLRVDDAIEEALLGVVNQAPLPPPSKRTVIWPANATRFRMPFCATSRRRAMPPTGHSDNTTRLIRRTGW